MSETLAQSANNSSVNDVYDVNLELARVKQLVADILAEARLRGASDAEAGVSRDLGLHVQVRQGDVETVEFNRDGGFGVTVYFGQAKGSASTNDTSTAAIKATVKAACDIARHTAADEFAGLAAAERLAHDIPDLDMDYPWSLSPEQAIELALRCENAGLQVHPLVKKTENISVSTHRGVRFYGNTRGFAAGFPSTRHSLSATFIAENASGMQRDYWYTVARDPLDLFSPESVAKRAAERAAARLDARRMTTGKYPVLLIPEVARGFFGHFFGAIKGGAQYRKSSFLLDSLGQQVWPDWLSLRECPRVPKGMASGAFDDDGVATYEHDLVRAGCISSYILSTYSARRLGLASTGNAGGLHNVDVISARPKLDYVQLIKQMGEGLVVTSVMGHGVNGVTGDYSRGANGFYVKNGEIQYPVEELTIAGNLRDLMPGLQAVGSDVDPQSSIWTGSILIDGFTIAG